MVKVYGVEPAEQILKMCGSQSSKADKIQADSVYQYDDEDKSSNFVNIHFPTVGWLGAIFGTLIVLLALFCVVRKCKPWTGGQGAGRPMQVNRMPLDGQIMQQMPQYQAPEYMQMRGARPVSMEMAAGADYNKMFGPYEEKYGQGRLDNYRPTTQQAMP